MCPSKKPRACDLRTHGQSLRDEFDRADVSATVAQRAAKSMVEDGDVASAEAASVRDVVSKLEGHLVHEAERAAACRLGETNAVRCKLAERVWRQVL